MSNANDMQVGGTHYRSEYQHWDFVANALGYRYFEGNATKYVARWRKKNGVADLEKALHYLNKLMELASAGMFDPLYMNARRITGGERGGYISDEVYKFCKANELGDHETDFIYRVAVWEEYEELESARVVLVTLIALAEQDGAEPGPGYVAQG